MQLNHLTNHKQSATKNEDPPVFQPGDPDLFVLTISLHFEAYDLIQLKELKVVALP